MKFWPCEQINKYLQSLAKQSFINLYEKFVLKNTNNLQAIWYILNIHIIIPGQGTLEQTTPKEKPAHSSQFSHLMKSPNLVVLGIHFLPKSKKCSETKQKRVINLKVNDKDYFIKTKCVNWGKRSVLSLGSGGGTVTESPGPVTGDLLPHGDELTRVTCRPITGDLSTHISKNPMYSRKLTAKQSWITINSNNIYIKVPLSILPICPMRSTPCCILTTQQYLPCVPTGS